MSSTYNGTTETPTPVGDTPGYQCRLRNQPLLMDRELQQRRKCPE